ncbi:hypothetical protein HZS_7943 [Henneguya salminicola]|nr:hypothetical protein HZS_7943 [Henneguya salminicola]
MGTLNRLFIIRLKEVYLFYRIKDSDENIHKNFDHYCLNKFYVGSMAANMYTLSFSTREIFDAVVSDRIVFILYLAPYGVRESVGSDKSLNASKIIEHLIEFSALYLKSGGFLVFCYLTDSINE